MTTPVWVLEVMGCSDELASMSYQGDSSDSMKTEETPQCSSELPNILIVWYEVFIREMKMKRVTISMDEPQHKRILEIGKTILDDKGKSGVNFSETCRAVFDEGIRALESMNEQTIPPLFLVDMVPDEDSDDVKLMVDGCIHAIGLDNPSTKAGVFRLVSSASTYPFFVPLQLVYEHVDGRGRPEIRELKAMGSSDLLPYEGVHDLRAWSGFDPAGAVLCTEYNRKPLLRRRTTVELPNKLQAWIGVKNPPGERGTDLFFRLKVLATFGTKAVGSVWAT
jgi:hypothetical protein